MRKSLLSGISSGFPQLSRSCRQVAHVLLTRPPLVPPSAPEGAVGFTRTTCMY